MTHTKFSEVGQSGINEFAREMALTITDSERMLGDSHWFTPYGISLPYV